MTGRNNRAIVYALEVMALVMGQASLVLHNQNGMADNSRGMGKFQRNNPPTFKGR